VGCPMHVKWTRAVREKLGHVLFQRLMRMEAALGRRDFRPRVFVVCMLTSVARFQHRDGTHSGGPVT
jgi:hypothetical protein